MVRGTISTNESAKLCGTNLHHKFSSEKPGKRSVVDTATYVCPARQTEALVFFLLFDLKSSS
jgi:hypothetical protein